MLVGWQAVCVICFFVACLFRGLGFHQFLIFIFNVRLYVLCACVGCFLSYDDMPLFFENGTQKV